MLSQFTNMSWLFFMKDCPQGFELEIGVSVDSTCLWQKYERSQKVRVALCFLLPLRQVCLKYSGASWDEPCSLI